MDSDLYMALEHQRAGRFADAARLYSGLLRRMPDHPEALHLFGVMHHQCGHSERAAEMITRAVTISPGAAVFHANLSEILRTLGQNVAAVESAREALRLDGNYPEAANNLGLALQALGRDLEAMECFQSALRLRPGFALARNNLGTVLKRLGRDEEATDAFRKAVEEDPASALAWANLGQALVDSGEAEAGLEHCLEAVRLEPTLAAAQNNLGNAYRALDRVTEACSAYAEALRLSPGIAGARVHSNLGLALLRQGQIRRAFVCLRRGVELSPDDPEVWRNLAEAHAEEDDYAQALPCCERVLALGSGTARDYNNLGWVLQQEGRADEAAAHYDRAIEMKDDFVDAILNRGHLHEELGRMAEAEACYRRALTVSSNPVALARLATLLRGGLPDEDRVEIRRKLDDLSPEHEAVGSLLYGLAQVSDARREYGDSAACLREANRLAKTRRLARNRDYDAAEHREFVDRLIRDFNGDLFSRFSGTGHETIRPVFVVGMPRSGTTLVEQILASHSRVHGAGELRLARRSFERIPAAVDGGSAAPVPCPSALDAEAVAELAERHLADLEAIARGGETRPLPDRIVDKMPDNYLYLGLLMLLFPRATFIHVRRDPRDVAFSCWMTSFRGIRWADDVDNLASRFQEHRRLMLHWRDSLPHPLHEVSYERLVDDFEAESRRLIEICGLEWEPACLEFHRTDRPVRTASVTQVRQPIYRKSLDRWKAYESELSDLFSRIPVD